MKAPLQKEEMKMSKDRAMMDIMLELSDIDAGDDELEIMVGGDTQVDIHDFDYSNDDEFLLGYLDSMMGGNE